MSNFTLKVVHFSSALVHSGHPGKPTSHGPVVGEGGKCSVTGSQRCASFYNYPVTHASWRCRASFRSRGHVPRFESRSVHSSITAAVQFRAAFFDKNHPRCPILYVFLRNGSAPIQLAVASPPLPLSPPPFNVCPGYNLRKFFLKLKVLVSEF